MDLKAAGFYFGQIDSGPELVRAAIAITWPPGRYIDNLPISLASI